MFRTVQRSTPQARLASLCSVLAGFLVHAGAIAQPGKPQVTEPAKIVSFAKGPRAACEGLAGCDFILLNGNPKTGPTQWFYRLKAGTPFPRHWHTSPENFIVVTGALTFNLESGQVHTLKPGEYMGYQGGMIHWGQCEAGEDCLYYVFNSRPFDFHLVK